MSAHWKSVLPIDRYVVRLNGLLHDHDRQVLTRLYQPLMGAAAYSLYMTLWSEADKDRLWGRPSTHHGLMAAMQMNLDHIYAQRRKLEALSLLNSFVKEEQGSKIFLYQLEPPFDPEKFFHDEVLSVYLYNRIGSKRFESLRKEFAVPAVDLKQFQSVTASFNEVFSSVHHSELMPKDETAAAMHPDEGQEWVGRRDADHLQIDEKSFDFDTMMAHLSDLVVPKETITAEVKQAILKLAFVYNLEPLEMGERVQRAYVDGAGKLEVFALREEVQKWYAFENDNRLPSLSFRVQPVKYRTMVNRQPANDEERIISAFETYSPADLLEQIAGGAKPALSDLRIVENIMFEQKLPPGVVNVLIDYVTTTNDMKLNRNYVEKIASHWARKKTKTVAEAMTLARSEHQKYQNWAQSGSAKAKSTTRRRPKRVEPMPQWMTEKKQSAPDPGWEARKKQLEKELKDL